MSFIVLNRIECQTFDIYCSSFASKQLKMLSSFVSTLFFENLVGNVQQFKNLSDKIGASELTQQFLKKGFKMCGIVGAVGLVVVVVRFLMPLSD